MPAWSVLLERMRTSTAAIAGCLDSPSEEDAAAAAAASGSASCSSCTSKSSIRSATASLWRSIPVIMTSSMAKFLASRQPGFALPSSIAAQSRMSSADACCLGELCAARFMQIFSVAPTSGSRCSPFSAPNLRWSPMAMRSLASVAAATPCSSCRPRR